MIVLLTTWLGCLIQIKAATKNTLIVLARISMKEGSDGRAYDDIFAGVGSITVVTVVITCLVTPIVGMKKLGINKNLVYIMVNQ